MDVSAFEWISQLRFYWDKKSNDVIIKQTNTKQLYGYEYLGNSGRLVITPLTNRCYIALTTAMHMYHGGNLKGSEYTGKTETIKDLGKHLAKYVIIINCSKCLDYKSINRIFLGKSKLFIYIKLFIDLKIFSILLFFLLISKGIVQQGAWCCFSQINQIKIEVLSSMTQQILSIFTALAANLKTLTIENKNIALVPTCSIFITTSSSYKDNTKLPDNFKSMFRTTSMIVPDSKLIIETILFVEGFKNAKNLANKLFVLLSLFKQLFNKYYYYEYGLQSLIALIKYAGKYKRENASIPEDEVY